MNIVVVSPSGASFSLAQQLGQGAVHFATWANTPLPEDHTLEVLRVERPSSGRLARRLADALNTSVLGRNVVRLSPWDTGRLFARSAARNGALRSALADADLVIAAERDAVLAVWRTGRALAPASAHLVYGLAAARSLISAEASN